MRAVRRPEYDDLAVGALAILFPIVVLLGASGIVVGILNSYEHFSVPALTPVAWNLVIILGLVLGVPRADTVDGELYVYAVVDRARHGDPGAAAAAVAARSATDGCGSSSTGATRRSGGCSS